MQQEEILRSLKEFEQTISSNFNDDIIQGIETEGLQRSLRMFKNSVIKEIDNDIQHAKAVIASPIYVGLLGRYSHGKSALVNALFKLDDDCRLPEGEGVVTSKVTLVDFANIPIAEAFEIITNEDLPRPITTSELLNNVGNSDKDTSCVESYKMTLPTNNRDFAANFLSSNITLVDMPGLGGPYFNDKVATAKYLKYMDMALVAIKIDEIEDAARHIRFFVEDLNIPIIPILTYQDLWQSSDLYVDCKDETSMLAKAQSLLEEHLPSLKKYCINLIAVSSIKDANGKEHQNVAALRKIILDQITNKRLAIEKAHTEIAPIYKKQVIELSKEFGNLKVKLERLLKEINDELNKWLPNSKDVLSLNDAIGKNRVIKRAKERFLTEAKRVISDCAREYRDRMQEIRNKSSFSDLQDFVKNFEDRVSERFANQKNRINDLNREFLNTLNEQVQVIIEQMQFDRQTKKELSNRIGDLLDRNSFEWDYRFRTSEKARNSIDSAYRVFTANTASNWFNELIKNPTNLILIGVGILMLLIPSDATFLKIEYGKIAIFGLVPIAIAFFNVYQSIPAKRRNEMNELQNKLTETLQGDFNEVEWKEDIEKAILKNIDEITEDLIEEMSADTELYNRDVQEFIRIKDEIEDGKEELARKIEEELLNLRVSIR